MTSNRVYWWRLLIKEFGPEIVYIKGIPNTVADAISRLDYDTKINPDYHCHLIQDEVILVWKAFSKCLACCASSSDITHNNTFENWYNIAFADHSKEDDIFPLTISEIADAQWADKHLQKLFKYGGKNKSATNSTLVMSQYQVSLV